jgi:hypothetical protein
VTRSASQARVYLADRVIQGIVHLEKQQLRSTTINYSVYFA